ncbi:TonB-dependent receptor [Flavobacterium suaedae]|uniref:TonB-dependent receptor n=1 Tax=Flavobacterium suaedae TaxID=1767027 RepID=A0ABQ1K6M3_9FLAO|nr:TonB-dependent receptor [Flavobacterium suaedae]GGB86039.1 TonB-dependent receptor [Flavobacterium suaedae]
MKALFTFTVLVLTYFTANAQHVISGKITDGKGNPLMAANIYLDGTYDGATSGEDGSFSFETAETGNQVLVISFISFEDVRQPIVVESYKAQTFKMRESVNTLDAVVLSAGTFEAGDNAKVNALKPLDIVTTAGSMGDIVSALQTLPGTNTVGESGRLFVRGGEADETQTFIDGIRVAQPYGATANNLPTRGRFSPFLFKGMTFSTGGYSAEYGEALSSVLLLKTIDEPTQNQTDISLMTLGLGLGNTKMWDNSSLSFNLSYINLEPYQELIPQNITWNKPYQSLAGESVYRYKFTSGLLKVYAAFDYADFSINQEDVNFEEPVRTGIDNNNFYTNASYNGMLPNQWVIHTGFSYGYSHNDIGINGVDVKNREHSSHIKLKFKKKITNRFKLSFGSDYFLTDFNEDYNDPNIFSFNSEYNNSISAVYAEADIFFSKDLALKAGWRNSYSEIVDNTTIEPRVSLAYKAGKKGQFSLAYGDFYQTPKQDYLKYYSTPDYEKTSHYIANYMYNNEGKVFRAEAYYKDYKDLIKYDTQSPQYNSTYNNLGEGYAQGVDLFWRDEKSIKNMQYWVSYSFIDSERDYKNYEYQVTPSYIAKHNFSIVTKYWINDLKSQLGVTYSFNSGRPYDNPNESTFMNSQTKAYNNLSLSWAWLLSQQKILFFSVSNVMGSDNVFGYNYANTPNANGQYMRQAITQPADRFFFVGFFWTISTDKKTNQLDNL